MLAFLQRNGLGMRFYNFRYSKIEYRTDSEVDLFVIL